MASSISAGGEWEPPSLDQMGVMLPSYSTQRLLGRGGMGAVYEAIQTNLDRRVAIKVLPETLGADNGEMKFAERFELEAKSMAKLDHPGIISVYDFGKTSEGHLYFVMEFIDGMDIHQYLQIQGGKLPADQAIAITAHVLDALSYSHQLGIIHRDIKPANIMIKTDGRVKVADFGLAKRLSNRDGAAQDSGHLTMTNMAFGTPDYVAPESLEAGRAVDHRADLYAVGVMLYNLLTGTVPRGNFRPPSGRVGGLDPRVDAIVARAMEADPDHRFQSAGEFRTAIDQMLTTPIPLATADAPPPAMMPSRAGRGYAPHSGPQEGTKKRWALLAGIGVTAVALIVGLIVSGGGGENENNDLPGGGADSPHPEIAEADKRPRSFVRPEESPDESETRPEPKSETEMIKEPGTTPEAVELAKSDDTPRPSPSKPPAEIPPEPSVPSPPDPATPDPHPEPSSPQDGVDARLADLENKFKDTFEAPYNESLATLKEQFLTALKREADAATGGGDLDVVLAFQNEAKRIEAGEGAGDAEEEGAPPRLLALRKTWHTQSEDFASKRDAKRAESLVALNHALKAYQAELVKGKDIEGAQLVRDWQAGLTNAASPVPSPTDPAAPGVGKPRLTSIPGDAGRPLITVAPERKEAPERPGRIGELVMFNLTDPSNVKVLAEKVVQFRAGGGGVIAMRPSGELFIAKGAGGWPAYDGFPKHKAKLTDVVSFNMHGGNNIAALRADGTIACYGDPYFQGHWKKIRDDQPRGAVEIIDGDALAALTDTGRIHPIHALGYGSFLADQRQVADMVVGKGKAKVPMILTERGSLKTPEKSPLGKEMHREISRVRNAVRIAAHHGFIALLDTGELLTWGDDAKALKLPPDLPRDIEAIQAGCHGRGVGEHHGIFAVKSQTRGWFFFGEKIDTERLAVAAEGCFALEINFGWVFGLRDPAPKGE